MDSNKLPLRKDVSADLKWSIEDLYKNNEDFKSDYNKLKELLNGFSKFKGTLSTSSDSLLECLKFNDEVSKLAENIYVYANMKFHEDTSDNFYQGLVDQAQNIITKLSTVSSFIVPEILSIDENTIKEFINSNEGLKVYKQYLNNTLRQKEHILSQEIEEILAKAEEITETADNIFSMFNDADIKFPDIKNEKGELVEFTKGKYITFLESSDRRVREDALKASYTPYTQYKNTLATTYNANVKKDYFLANVRKYDSCVEAALDDSNIPINVYHNLIKTVNNNLHLLHKYVSLRKKLLNLDELHSYDLYVPLVKDVKQEIPFNEAKQKVIDGLQVMGNEYVNLLKKGFDERWIDVVENQSKRSGAYAWGAYGTHPFVLLNYQDNLHYVFTLAHEMGHALHSYYSDETQPYIYAGYKIFLAEVASTVNEALLMDYMINTTEDKMQKAYLVNHFLEQFKGTLFRQTMFAEFEMTTHDLVEKGEALTVEALCSLYRELNKKYYGNDIVIDEQINMEWARIPHFYSAFYVYQYATGYSAAIALSQKILKEGQPAVEKYTTFLKSGSSDYPIEILKKAGVDMSTPEPIENALKVFDNLLNQLEQLLS